MTQCFARSRFRRRISFIQGILVSHKLAPALLAIIFLAIASLSGARAEPSSAPVAGTAATLSPDEARRALETLQDDQKRAQMIDTLRAIANVSPQAAPAAPATATNATAGTPAAPASAPAP